MTTDKTYDHGPRINEVAGQIITHLFDYGEVRGATIDRTWRPASVVLAMRLFPELKITTNSSQNAAGYTAYYTTMAALDLLENAELIVVDRESTGNQPTYRIALAEEI